MGEAPAREDGTVTRSAEVGVKMRISCCVLQCVSYVPAPPPSSLLNSCLTVKYVGSFPVDDCCLDEQIEQLHAQLKALRVSPAVVLMKAKCG